LRFHSTSSYRALLCRRRFGLRHFPLPCCQGAAALRLKQRSIDVACTREAPNLGWKSFFD
jgi:hypothetical protein